MTAGPVRSICTRTTWRPRGWFSHPTRTCHLCRRTTRQCETSWTRTGIIWRSFDREAEAAWIVAFRDSRARFVIWQGWAGSQVDPGIAVRSVEIQAGVLADLLARGTARMGDDPETSVLDADCRSWDIANLWVCDGSVFSTVGGVNPSLTIQGITCCTADRIGMLASRGEV